MARYRRIDPYIWHDDKFPAFSDDAKLLFFHLLTSPRGNPLGCFVQGKPDMAEYLKWPMKRFAIPFKELLLSHRVEYDETTRLLLIPNYLKYNPLENENQAKMACKYLSELPYNHQFFQYLKLYLERYDKKNVGPLLDGLANRIGNGTPNTEPFLSEPFLSETEPKKELLSGSDKPDVARDVLTYLNSKTGHKYRPEKTNLALIQARLATATVEQIQAVIDAKVTEWKGDQKMRQFLRPSTLFRATNFEQYLGQINGQPPTGSPSGSSRAARREAWKDVTPGEVKL